MVGHTALEILAESNFLYVREGSSFPCLALPKDIVNSKSVVDIRPDDVGVVTGYLIDENI